VNKIVCDSVGVWHIGKEHRFVHRKRDGRILFEFHHYDVCCQGAVKSNGERRE